MAIDPEDLAALPALLEAVDGQDWPDPDAESKLRALAPSVARALLAAEAEKGRLRAENEALRPEGEFRYLVECWAEARREFGAHAVMDSLDARFHRWQAAEHALLAALAAYDAARTGREEGRDG